MNDAPSSTPIAVEKTGQALIVRPQFKVLDERECGALVQSIDAAAGADARVTVVVLDLSRVENLPSLGLGGLLKISDRCRSRDQKLKLAAVPPRLRQVLSITRLDRVFDLSDTVAAAIG